MPAARERGESVAAAIAPAPATNALRRDVDGVFSSIVELILFSLSEECGGDKSKLIDTPGQHLPGTNSVAFTEKCVLQEDVVTVANCWHRRRKPVCV